MLGYLDVVGSVEAARASSFFYGSCTALFGRINNAAIKLCNH